MHDEYDNQGDVVMRDASFPGQPCISCALDEANVRRAFRSDTAMDQLAVRFSRFSLVDPPIHRVSDDVLYELFMSLAGTPSAENCDFIVLLSHVCQVGS